MQKCKFFCWAGTSPTISPPATQISTNPSASTTASMVTHLTSLGDVTCAHPDCQTIRLAPGCVNKRCRRHCRLVGNCNYKSHVVNTSAVNNSAPASSAPADYSGNNFFASQGYGPPTASTTPHALTAAPSPPRATSSTF